MVATKKPGVLKLKPVKTGLEKIVPGSVVDIGPIRNTRGRGLMLCNNIIDDYFEFFGRIKRGEVIGILISINNIVIGKDGTLIFENRMESYNLATYCWQDDRLDPDYQKILRGLKEAGL